MTTTSPLPIPAAFSLDFSSYHRSSPSNGTAPVASEDDWVSTAEADSTTSVKPTTASLNTSRLSLLQPQKPPYSPSPLLLSRGTFVPATEAMAKMGLDTPPTSHSSENQSVGNITPPLGLTLDETAASMHGETIPLDDRVPVPTKSSASWWGQPQPLADRDDTVQALEAKMNHMAIIDRTSQSPATTTTAHSHSRRSSDGTTSSTSRSAPSTSAVATPNHGGSAFEGKDSLGKTAALGGLQMTQISNHANRVPKAAPARPDTNGAAYQYTNGNSAPPSNYPAQHTMHSHSHSLSHGAGPNSFAAPAVYPGYDFDVAQQPRAQGGYEDRNARQPLPSHVGLLNGRVSNGAGAVAVPGAQFRPGHHHSASDPASLRDGLGMVPHHPHPHHQQPQSQQHVPPPHPPPHMAHGHPHHAHPHAHPHHAHPHLPHHPHAIPPPPHGMYAPHPHHLPSPAPVPGNMAYPPPTSPPQSVYQGYYSPETPNGPYTPQDLINMSVNMMHLPHTHQQHPHLTSLPSPPYAPSPMGGAGANPVSAVGAGGPMSPGMYSPMQLQQMQQMQMQIQMQQDAMNLGPSANNRKLGLYKTELCRSWEEKGSCRYGPKCQFAHGEDEVRKVTRHPKYKTEICRTFWVSGSCPYGKRCCFIHTELPSVGTPGIGGPDGPFPAGAPSNPTGSPPPAQTASSPSGPDGRARSMSTNSDPNEQPSSLLARISAKSRGGEGGNGSGIISRPDSNGPPLSYGSASEFGVGAPYGRPASGSLRVDTSTLDQGNMNASFTFPAQHHASQQAQSHMPQQTQTNPNRHSYSGSESLTFGHRAAHQHHLSTHSQFSENPSPSRASPSPAANPRAFTHGRSESSSSTNAQWGGAGTGSIGRHQLGQVSTPYSAYPGDSASTPWSADQLAINRANERAWV